MLVPEHIIIDGTFNAAAIFAGPESRPIKNPIFLIRHANCGKFNLPLRSMVFSNTPLSPFEPTNKTLYPFSFNSSISLQKFSRGHSFAFDPANG